LGYSFEDLEVYKAARQFRQKIYQLLKDLPREEQFNLQSQMRRAAVSLTNNIAEGHGRFHCQENIQFLRQARGSLEELMDDLNVCLDEKYVTIEVIEQLKSESNDLLKRFNGHVVFLRNRKNFEK